MGTSIQTGFCAVRAKRKERPDDANSIEDESFADVAMIASGDITACYRGRFRQSRPGSVKGLVKPKKVLYWISGPRAHPRRPEAFEVERHTMGTLCFFDLVPNDFCDHHASFTIILISILGTNCAFFIGYLGLDIGRNMIATARGTCIPVPVSGYGNLRFNFRPLPI